MFRNISISRHYAKHQHHIIDNMNNDLFVQMLKWKDCDHTSTMFLQNANGHFNVTHMFMSRSSIDIYQANLFLFPWEKTLCAFDCRLMAVG